MWYIRARIRAGWVKREAAPAQNQENSGISELRWAVVVLRRLLFPLALRPLEELALLQAARYPWDRRHLTKDTLLVSKQVSKRVSSS